MPSTTPNASDAVSETYARAWFDLAKWHRGLDEAADEAEQLAALFAEHGELRALFENPAIDAGDRAGLIDRLFGGRVSDLTRRFLQVVNRHGRSARIGSILAAFAAMVDAHRGIVAATATVVEELPGDRLDTISARLGESLGGKRVRLHQRLDADLIGGVRLRIGDRLLDASVATRLRSIERSLREQGRERAREKVARGRGPGFAE